MTIPRNSNHKETPSPRKPVMEGILKHTTRPTGKIKSATIFTKKTIHLLILPTTRRKRTMVITSTSPVKKVKPGLKTCPKIWRRLQRPSPPYKIRQQILNRKNPTYQTQMESHTQIRFFYWSKTTRGWKRKKIQTNRLYCTKTLRIDPCKII